MYFLIFHKQGIEHDSIAFLLSGGGGGKRLSFKPVDRFFKYLTVLTSNWLSRTSVPHLSSEGDFNYSSSKQAAIKLFSSRRCLNVNSVNMTLRRQKAAQCVPT